MQGSSVRYQLLPPLTLLQAIPDATAFLLGINFLKKMYIYCIYDFSHEL